MRTKKNLSFSPQFAALAAVTMLAAGCNGNVVTPVSATGTTSTVNTPGATSNTPGATSNTPGATSNTPGATSGSATLSWIPPTQNLDGSPITDLSGYHIYYGTNADALTTTITVNGGSSSTYKVSDLGPGTYYFSVVAYNAEGVDSPESNLESKTI
jgi:hypothetical protein